MYIKTSYSKLHLTQLHIKAHKSQHLHARTACLAMSLKRKSLNNNVLLRSA